MYELKKREPSWLTLRAATAEDPAVEVLMAPYGRKVKRAALLAARAAALAQFPDLPDDLKQADTAMLQAFVEALSAETIRAALIDWRGIGNESGEPIPVSPEAVDVFLQDEDLLDEADRLYVGPGAKRDAEKNGLLPSPNGTSAGAPDIAAAAPSPAAVTSPGKSAPTSKKHPRAPRAKKSGPS